MGPAFYSYPYTNFAYILLGFYVSVSGIWGAILKSVVTCILYFICSLQVCWNFILILCCPWILWTWCREGFYFLPCRFLGIFYIILSENGDSFSCFICAHFNSVSCLIVLDRSFYIFHYYLEWWWQTFSWCFWFWW